MFAKLGQKLGLNKNNYDVIQYLALEVYTQTPQLVKDLPHAGFILLQFLFMANQIQYLNNYVKMVFQNVYYATQMLMAISCKTSDMIPVFY